MKKTIEINSIHCTVVFTEDQCSLHLPLGDDEIGMDKAGASLLCDALCEFLGVNRLLREEMGDAIEGCSLLESVALLVSQRENARNAHVATQSRLEKVEAALERLLAADETTPVLEVAAIEDAARELLAK